MSFSSHLPATRTVAAPSFWRRARTLAEEGWRYLLASVVALAVDFCLLVFLTEVAHLNYLVSAAVGFSAGLLVTYVISVRLIFKERRLGRRMEVAAFVVIGIVGLGLNEILMRIFVGGLGLHYALAKVPAAGASFVFNFAARRLFLFTAKAPASSAMRDG